MVFIFPDIAVSQAFHFYTIDPSGFPPIKYKYHAKDGLGDEVDTTKYDFRIKEN